MNATRLLFEEIWEQYFFPGKKQALPLTHIFNAFTMEELVQGDIQVFISQFLK